MLAAVAVKVPAPLVAVAAARLRLELTPWVQLPVRVNVPLIVTVPVQLLVSVVDTAGVTVPPNVIALEPARAWVAENAALPVPELNVVPFMVMPAAKLVTAAYPEKSMLPVLIVTAPVNVFVPVALETASVPPLIVVVPAKVTATPPSVKVLPEST